MVLFVIFRFFILNLNTYIYSFINFFNTMINYKPNCPYKIIFYIDCIFILIIIKVYYINISTILYVVIL